jgi:small subunit ribosomal protein S9
MALSVSTLAAALSHLSLPSTSTSKPHPAPLFRLHPTSAPCRRLALRASAAEPAELPAEEVLAVEEEEAEDQLSGIALRKYVKQRLPGGFAAQRITATGRRKTAIARVVLQEGTGKVLSTSATPRYLSPAVVMRETRNAGVNFSVVPPLSREFF